MNKTLILLMLTGAPLLMSAPAAEAHDRGPHGHHHYDAYHAEGMPHWLRRKHGFTRWYFRTPLRFNYRLDWGELYSIYRWEKRYFHQRRPHHYAHIHDRGFRFYKRYWKHDYHRGHRKGHRQHRKAYRDDDYDRREHRHRKHRSDKDRRYGDKRRRDSRRD